MAAAAASGLCAEWSGPIQGGVEGGEARKEKGEGEVCSHQSAKGPSIHLGVCEPVGPSLAS